MATLNNTYGITLVVGTSSAEYGGAASNQFFGGPSDRIAMLRYNAPSALGANDVVTLANYIGYFKADATGDSDSITIGLVDGAWTTTTTNFATLYGYIEATTTTASLTTTTTATEKTLAITSLLNTWAATPSAYSGIYFRCPTMTMTRIGATGQSITTTVQTIMDCTAPASTSLSATTVDPLAPLTYSWSGASGGTLNSITGYIVEYQHSENGGSTWSAWDTFGTVNTANSYGSITVYGHDVFGGLVRVRVKTIGSAGASYYSDPTNYLTYTTNSPVAGAPPSTVSVSAAMAAPGAAISLSWSGASAGYLNPTVGYIIARSEDGGAYNNSWATDTASPYTVYAHATYGHYYTYKVITDGQYIDSTASTDTAVLTTLTPTACGAPSTANLSASVAETAPTLTYSGASAGTINGITGYEIQYAESANNSTWGAWTALKTVANTGTSGTTSVNLSSTRGYYRKYQIRTQGSAGASYYSGWKETASVRYNSAPTAPTTFNATPAVYVSGTIALTYTGATDADNNISTYNVQYATSADGVSWSSWTSLANGATSHTPTLSPGHYIKYQARTVDAFAVVSGWKASNLCGKNTAPAAPVVTYPQNSKTIYNSRPRFLVTMGADPESHAMTLAASGFTLSRSSGLVGGSKITARRTSAASAGAVSISATATDQYSESSSAAARSTTYAVPSFTDDPVESGTTAIKAAHVNELRTMVNNVRKYYGFGTNLLPGTSDTLANITVGQYVASITADPHIVFSSKGLNAGDKVTFRIYLKPAGTKRLAARISQYDADGGYVSSVGNYIAVDGEGYSSVTVTIGTGRTYLRCFIQNGDPDSVPGNTTEQYKEAKLERGCMATPWDDSSAVAWAETITAGVTKSRNWAAHIVEMQDAVDDVVTLVNGWDAISSTNRIAAFTWISPGVKPSAAVINQIRQVITWL